MKLRKYPDPILRKKAVDVIEFNLKLEKQVERMKNFIDGKGIGLAANQVGYNNKVIIYWNNGFKELINPKILVSSDNEEKLIEGCLSLPGLEKEVKRPSSVMVSGRLLNGSFITFTAFDLTARIIQHEIDHLEGKLILDYD